MSRVEHDTGTVSDGEWDPFHPRSRWTRNRIERIDEHAGIPTGCSTNDGARNDGRAEHFTDDENVNSGE